MKFKKFMKELGVNGKIFKNGEDRWLVSPSVAMLIPKEVGVILADVEIEAPNWFKEAVTKDYEANICHLTKAVILDAEGKANSIIRVFETEDGESIGIKNPFFALLEKDDILNIYTNDKDQKSLRVIAYEDYKPKCVGIIMQYKYEKEEM